MDMDVQAGPLEIERKLRVSFKKILFGEMEDAECIPVGLISGGDGKEVKGASGSF